MYKSKKSKERKGNSDGRKTGGRQDLKSLGEGSLEEQAI